MSRLATRVARLENHLRMDESAKAVVCWIGPDGVPEDLPTHLDGSVRVLYLPRKSASPEAWMHECALRRETAWLHSEGLAALLAAAKPSPLQSCDLESEDLDDDRPPSSLRRLLEEARQYRQSMVLGS